MNDPITALALALLGVAAGSDVAQRRIPNVVPTALAAVALVGAAGAGGAFAVLLHVAGAAVLAAALVLAWRARIVGGGDVKLAVAAALWLGPARLPAFAVVTMIAGGGVALVTLFASVARPALQPGAGTGCSPVRLPRATVPYGVAIALGGAFVALR